MNTPIIQILAGIGFLVFGLYKLWKTIEYFRRRSASMAWPVMAGEVVSKRVVETSSPRSGKSYYPEIMYKYSVMGQEFENKKMLVGIYSRKSAEKAINDFGTAIELHYNPENPSEHITDLDKVKIFDILLIIIVLALAGFTLYRLLV
jgi:hypothetical protein